MLSQNSLAAEGYNHLALAYRKATGDSVGTETDVHSWDAASFALWRAEGRLIHPITLPSVLGSLQELSSQENSVALLTRRPSRRR
jgi:hypothetical protein